MRLGASGLGVIAAVSLLVTAAPETKNEMNERSRVSRVDRSRTSISWHVDGFVSVADRIEDSRNRFLKIDHDRPKSLSRFASSSIPHSPSFQPTMEESNVRRAKSEPELLTFPVDSIAANGASPQARNFEGSRSPSYNQHNANSLKKLEDKPTQSVGAKSRLTVIPSSGILMGKFAVSFDPSVSKFISGSWTTFSSVYRDPHRRHERETFPRDEETESQGRRIIEKSKRREDEVTTAKTGISRDEESSTTTNPTRISSGVNVRTAASRLDRVNVNFRDTTERYESPITINSPGTGNNEEIASVNESRVHHDETSLISDSVHKIISLRSSDRLIDSNYRHPTNYPIGIQPDVRRTISNVTRSVGGPNDREDRNVKRLSDDSRIDESANISSERNQSNRSKWNSTKQGGAIRDLSAMRERETTPKTPTEITIREEENQLDYSVTLRMPPARQISLESLPIIPIIETASLRYEKNISNAGRPGIDDPILDNDKAVRGRSFQTFNAENEKRKDSHSGFSSSSRFPGTLAVKKSAFDHEESSVLSRKTEPPSHMADQMSFAKSVNAIVKNITKQSINLLDGESNKIFYEIKPSLITDTDRDDDVDFTTTTKRNFEKFLLPSVPSALGKFGPYFLDEEDRRNVTERIGNTVQLDCRIGMLGHRKVTWLQHYKDSFRLLTVERESYSVDRRISLNFQYPDNWRLQIAYASLRDSGLYKCQVEIDQDKSLVKRYNVIITAPILTITDDSGRPVSGERHLKAGSTLKLRCEARDVSQMLNESVLWMRGDETLTDDVSENRTTEIVNEKEITIVTSTLQVERAVPSHAGNYSCIVPEKARTTIAVHVLNGELPAAVQHGSGVSTAVLNIWLVHLTASYGFFR